jgi:hypothetical protein
LPSSGGTRRDYTVPDYPPQNAWANALNPSLLRSHKFAQESFPQQWYDTSDSHALLDFQRKTLDDYAQDLAKQIPAPLTGLMRRLIGPALGRLIVRML